MFSLIITIISIALVAALAVATLYYGGTAFNRGADGAKAAQLINEGQQVNGAATMARADVAQSASTLSFATGTADDLADLVAANYLSQVPSNFSSATKLDAGYVTASVTTGVAKEVQARATNVQASTVTLDGASTVAALVTALPGQVYGANAAGFFYKF